MKKRHLIKPELDQWEVYWRKHKNDRMVHIIHQLGHLLDSETSITEAQLAEILHLLHAEECENKRSIGEIVSQTAMLINGLYLTHLLVNLLANKSK